MWGCLGCDSTPPYRPRISPGSTSVFGWGATVSETSDGAARVGFLQHESVVRRRLNNNRRHKATWGSTRRFSVHLNQHMMGQRVNRCAYHLSDFLFNVITATLPSLDLFFCDPEVIVHGIFFFFVCTQYFCF